MTAHYALRFRTTLEVFNGTFRCGMCLELSVERWKRDSRVCTAEQHTGTGFVAGLSCTGLCWIEKGCKRRSAVPHLTHTGTMQLAGLLARAAGSLHRSAATRPHPGPVFIKQKCSDTLHQARSD